MIYHLASWTFGDQPADTFLGRLGTYGVSMFYVLSGLTLQHVYSHHLQSWADTGRFFIRRIFRIFPLLWLATTMAIVVSRLEPDAFKVLLNFTGLFGFVAWDQYIATGAWSIGNELVFYALFPIIVWSARSKLGTALTGLVLGGIYVYFAFFALDPTAELSDEWGTYVHPLNQAFLFYCGFLIGHLLRAIQARRLLVHFVLWGGIVAFILWPTSIERIDIVTGWNRLAFTLICVAICAAIYKTQPRLPKPIHAPLLMLGHASYSVYLLHPIVYNSFRRLDRFSDVQNAALTVILTLLIAYATYRWIEMPINRFGRRVSNKL